MKSVDENKVISYLMTDGLSLETQVEVLFDVATKMLDDGAMRARVVRFKLQKYVNSENVYEKLFALNTIVSEGNGIKVVPDEKNAEKVLEETCNFISTELAKRYLKKKINGELEKTLQEKQEKYMDDMRLEIIRKKKGPENANTLKKLKNLEDLDNKIPSKNIICLLYTSPSPRD